ncbi:hypothetical protein A9174_13915 [Mesorhizobium loti NZP2037]|nr:hypothetical protein A9174_13915 [Mesorhizobium loti NZP2037]
MLGSVLDLIPETLRIGTIRMHDDSRPGCHIPFKYDVRIAAEGRAGFDGMPGPNELEHEMPGHRQLQIRRIG